ncbi:YgfZ/GcvT domain-containing protein [Ilumatobacter sp.]|uniref:CAF17-like 4Fe-4S cluster assembly/insertion protein YgfZ n=1 Tax=Ilumatobacter sp. TaxID=1967498 RepID=UPI003C3445B6
MKIDDAVTATNEFIDDAARDRVVVRGADAATYLQSQIAQEIRDLAVGDSRWTFVLDPTGKVESLARIRRAGDDEFVLDTDAGFGDGLLARINRFKIRVDAETTVEYADADSPSVEHELARIGGGWPRMGFEIEPGKTIPSATGVTTFAVNFQKGCYPGQELVERMDSRGADAPRSLRIVDLPQGGAPGDPVHDSDGNEVGSVTSVSGEGGLGIAAVKRGADIGRLPPHVT